MPQAIVNPEDLRRFSAELQHFLQELQQATTRLNAHFSQLGETWRDQEHQKFVEVYRETMQVLSRFMNAAGQHIPFLLRKAERIEEYLRQR